jgi:two-component system KDP operon response regulator KdpE
MTDAPVVLVIEDEGPLRRFLETGLEGEGWVVVAADGGHAGLSLAMQYVPDVVLVDLGLPDLEGVEVIRRLRAWSQAPVIVLSARSRERQKVEALDAGADDYLTKPFGFPELLARMRVALRRSARGSDGAAVYDHGGLRIDLAARSVRLDGEDVHLTPTEYRLLAVLARHSGRVVTHRQLLEAVWGPRSAGQSQYLRVHVAHLRRKLERPSRSFLTTEAGVGYRLRAD